LIFLLKGLFFKAAKVGEERRNGKKTGIKMKKRRFARACHDFEKTYRPVPIFFGNAEEIGTKNSLLESDPERE